MKNLNFLILLFVFQSSILLSAQTFNVSGNVRFINGQSIQNVLISLAVNGQFYKSTITDENGFYLFSNLPNGTYHVTAERNDNHLNGVSAHDLVLIHRHILGITQIDNPYVLLAADVNTNYSITAADIAHIRRLILGIDQDFQFTTSWVFIPASVNLSLMDPFNFNEKIEVNNNNASLSHDFIGVKKGDTSVSATTKG